MSDMLIEEVGDKFYATSKAWLVDQPEQLPREMAAEFDRSKLNQSFLWIAGRYVQANQLNRNGQFWTFDDIKHGEKSIQYTPLNALHKYDRPLGVFIQTKIVQREAADDKGEPLPEVQALAVMWAANFPEQAEFVRAAHKAGTLFFSMECVAESKQCLTCERKFEWAAETASLCEHLGSSAIAPRRFINPTFLGGALIFPPESPGWLDANVTEVARRLTLEYAAQTDGVGPEQWEMLMQLALEFAPESN